MDDVIYLDHQASTPLEPAVFEAMLPFFAQNPANPHSSHHISGLKASVAIEEARGRVAHLINADASEIFFTSGATEANNLAILGGNYGERDDKGVLVSSIEHKCVLEAARYRNRAIEQLPLIPVQSEGYVDLIIYEELLRAHKPQLVSIMLANNEIGSIQETQRLAKIAHKHSALFHCDAAQAPTGREIDVSDLEVDFLSLSAHKMNGPKGIGALYVSHSARSRIKPLFHGGGQEAGLRSGTLPTPLCVGFGKAAEIWMTKGEELRTRVKRTRDYFWNELKKTVPSARLIGPTLADRHNANLCVHFPKVDAELLLAQLQADLAASTGSACTTGIPEPSHVVAALGDDDALTDGTVRFSFGVQTGQDEVIIAVSLIRRVLEGA